MVITMAKLRMSHAWRTQAAWAKFYEKGEEGPVDYIFGHQKTFATSRMFLISGVSDTNCALHNHLIKYNIVRLVDKPILVNK